MNGVCCCVTQTGENPLHIAVRYCHWEVADELITFVQKAKTQLDVHMMVNAQNSVSSLLERVWALQCNFHDSAFKGNATLE